MIDQQNGLVEVVNQLGLDTNKSDYLMQNFVEFYGQAKDVVNCSKDIKVNDETQIDLMNRARESRLKLRDIRVECEKTRVRLKEQSLREGRAIDGIANVIKALIVPVEEHLEKQEKFAEYREAERRAKQYEERISKLSKYVTDVSLYSLKDMADEVFENLLSGCKLSWEKAREDEAKAEAERLAKIEADKAEQEKIRQENEKLRKEAEEKEKALEIERAKQAEELRKINEEKEKVEAKLRAEKEAQLKKEAQEKADAEAKLKAEEELKRKAMLAPDKEKLLEFATRLRSVTAPAVMSKDADIILEKAMERVLDAITILQEESKKL